MIKEPSEVVPFVSLHEYFGKIVEAIEREVPRSEIRRVISRSSRQSGNAGNGRLCQHQATDILRKSRRVME